MLFKKKINKKKKIEIEIKTLKRGSVSFSKPSALMCEPVAPPIYKQAALNLYVIIGENKSTSSAIYPPLLNLQKRKEEIIFRLSYISENQGAEIEERKSRSGNRGAEIEERN